MNVHRLASAIYNDIVSGLRGYHANPAINLQQLEDDIIATRLNIINLYNLKGMLYKDDLYYTINCIKTDNKFLDKCPFNAITHFEIPDLLFDLGKQCVKYIGAADKMHPFEIVYSAQDIENLKYRKVKKDKPIVWINTSINEQGLLDCYVFNSPVVVSNLTAVIAIKDPRNIQKCNTSDVNSYDRVTMLDSTIQEKLTKEKVLFYKHLQSTIKPNNQQYE